MKNPHGLTSPNLIKFVPEAPQDISSPPGRHLLAASATCNITGNVNLEAGTLKILEVSEKWTKNGNIIRHSPRCAHWKIPKCTKCTMLQVYISAGPPARTLEMTQMGWALVITGTKCEKKYCTSHMKVTSSNCLTMYTYYKVVQTV